MSIHRPVEDAALARVMATQNLARLNGRFRPIDVFYYCLRSSGWFSSEISQVVDNSTSAVNYRLQAMRDFLDHP